MGLIADGEAWLRTVRSAEAEAVTLTRGAAVTADVEATPAAAEITRDDGSVVVDADMADFLIDRAEYLISAAEVEPAPDDIITRTMGHGTEKFRVAEISGADCWEWHGRDGGTYRVHTVRIPNS